LPSASVFPVPVSSVPFAPSSWKSVTVMAVPVGIVVVVVNSTVALSPVADDIDVQ